MSARHWSAACAVLWIALLGSARACTLIYTKPSDVPELGVRVPVCRSFKPSGAPIIVPADTTTTKYGQLQVTHMGSSGGLGPMGGGGGVGPMGGGGDMPMGGGEDDAGGITATFFDRDGVSYQVLQTALPANSSQQQDLLMYSPQLLVKARLFNLTVTSFTLAMYIPLSTAIEPFRDTHFIGNVSLLNPPGTFPATQWVRWDFGQVITTTSPSKLDTQLHGIFTSMYQSIEHNGVCQPALCLFSARCEYYQTYFGNSTDMTMYWNPNMHTTTDSELVPIFSSSISYMAHFPYAYELLKPYDFYRNYEFGIHGNPVGTPFLFSGRLSKRTALPVLCTPDK